MTDKTYTYEKAILSTVKCCYKLYIDEKAFDPNWNYKLVNVTVTFTDDLILVNGTEIEYTYTYNYGHDGKYLDYVDKCIIPEEKIIKEALFGLIKYENRACWRIESGHYEKRERKPFHLKLNRNGTNFAIIE